MSAAAANFAEVTVPLGATYSLSIDGQPQPLAVVTLTKSNAKGNFSLGFGASSAQPDIVIIGSGRARLVVGRSAICDTTRSAIAVTADLPARFANECTLAKDAGFHSVLGPPRGSPLAFVHDWGAGKQELRGRKLGEFVFSRVSDTSADGSFESYVYCSSISNIEYQGRPRVFAQHKGHLLRGTFKNLPYADAGKAMNNLQDALKAVQGLR